MREQVYRFGSSMGWSAIQAVCLIRRSGSGFCNPHSRGPCIRAGSIPWVCGGRGRCRCCCSEGSCEGVLFAGLSLQSGVLALVESQWVSLSRCLKPPVEIRMTAKSEKLYVACMRTEQAKECVRMRTKLKTRLTE